MKSFKYAFGAIICLAILLRFINFSNRWGLGYDQASFAIVGKYALESLQLPLLGPFSSGGPFQTGGLWYWLIMLGNVLFPGLVIAPWIFMGVLSIIFVIGMMMTGVALDGPFLGILAGLITAMSTAQITQSTNLSNQTPIAVPSLLTIAAGLFYVKSKKPVGLFFVGLGIGAASAIHLQGLGLFPLVLVAIALGGVPTFTGLLLLGAGFFLPWLPVFWADAGHDWLNTKNMIRYYTIDQYTISLDVLGRRWLTFATQFIPSIWGFTIGGYAWTGKLTALISFGTAAYLFVTKKLTKPWFFILLSFVGVATVVRYARVPLYQSFVVIFHPFILLLTAGVLLFLFRIKTSIGVLFLLFLLVPTTVKNTEEISRATNLAASQAQRLQKTLIQTFPHEKFALFDYEFQTAGKTLALLLYLNRAGLLDPNGHRIGISSDAAIHDLQSSTSAQLAQNRWAYLDFKVIYDSVQNWWKKNY